MPGNEGDAVNEAIAPLLEGIDKLFHSTVTQQINQNLAGPRQTPVQARPRTMQLEAGSKARQPMDRNPEQSRLQMIASANQVGRQPIDQNLEQEEQNGSHNPKREI
jgi:hypothetical protein